MTTQTVSVAHILKTVGGSCDFGSLNNFQGATEDDQRTVFWQHVIMAKASDSGFGHLVDSILEEGFHGSAIGWEEYEGDDGTTGYISEGHHRLVAAILLGMDEIPVSPYGKSGNHDPRPGMGGGHFSAHQNNSSEFPYPISVEF